jgi:short-subunit dehydrogenase
MDFVGRYGPMALIAGGSEGVGAAYALQLAVRGLDIALVARKPGPPHRCST